jgi:hypothetical protein
MAGCAVAGYRCSLPSYIMDNGAQEGSLAGHSVKKFKLAETIGLRYTEMMGGFEDKSVHP